MELPLVPFEHRKVGTRVEVISLGNWYPGSIIGFGDNTVTVHFDQPFLTRKVVNSVVKKGPWPWSKPITERTYVEQITRTLEVSLSFVRLLT